MKVINKTATVHNTRFTRGRSYDVIKCNTRNCVIHKVIDDNGKEATIFLPETLESTGAWEVVK